MHPHCGALLHVLRNREYRVHYHPVNAPFHPDGLPEARLPVQLTHPGGGAWIAYKKHAPWAPLVAPLPLPQSCPRATTCAVELALQNGSKAAILSCYLPQTVEAHAATCDALSQLPGTLPHSLIIMGGDFQGGWDTASPKDAHIVALPYSRWKGPLLPTFAPRQRPLMESCIDHLTLWDPQGLSL